MKLFDECGQKQFMQRWTQKYGGDGFPDDFFVSKHQLFGVLKITIYLILKHQLDKNLFLVQIHRSRACSYTKGRKIFTANFFFIKDSL